MKAVYPSEMLKAICQIAWRRLPEDSDVHCSVAVAVDCIAENTEGRDCGMTCALAYL
jgi:hypothetical protein